MDQFRLGERQAAIGVDEQMAIGWSDVNRGGCQVIAFLGLLDSECGAPADAECVGHQAAVSRVEVLHHDNSRWEIGRQARQDLSKSCQSAG